MSMLTAAPTDLRAPLRQHFGYTGFRPLQEEAISAILGGRDSLVIMPTGGGKSLCYQLPALLLEGTTLVISPLIALMKDQVDALQKRGIRATFLNSSLDPAEAARRRAAVLRGEARLLYVAPERLLQPQTLDLLQRIRVPLVAVDEAHCISQWGHDFRPEYRALGDLRDWFTEASLAAFTATATRRVEADIIAQLRLGQGPRPSGTASTGAEKPRVFRGSFNRPNLYYQVRPKESTFAQVAEYCLRHPDASGIVYCLSRASTEGVALRLRDCRVAAQAYHAGLSADERRARQDAFQSGKARVMVATIAFGMGIDKPDVRFVIHYDMPQHLEGFYQESGRAGRDGKPSDCILFYSYGDVKKFEGFIEQKPLEEQRVAREQLRHMAAWAESSRCRRERLLAYFDERLAPEQRPIHCCDLCSPLGPPSDAAGGASATAAIKMPARSRLGSSPRESSRLFLDGQSPAAIAKARGLAESTVLSHLVEAAEAGERLPLERLVSPQRRRAIEAAVRAVGPGPLRPIRDRLGEEYAYGEIRIVMVLMGLWAGRPAEG